MRVLLINPRTEAPGKRFDREPPIGMLHIAAVLEKAGHSVEIQDLSMRKLEIEQLPDLVGIGCLTNTYNMSIEILKDIKSNYPGVRTVIGGPHVTFKPYDALATGVVDYVVRGEGEDAFLKIWDKPMIYAPPVDINTLPLPARHLLQRKYRVASILINRGCPYKCAFCVRQRLFQHDVRLRDPANVAVELKQVESFGYEYVNFYDNINIKLDHAFEVCKAVRQLGVNLPWGCELRSDFLTEKLAQALSKSGCRAIGTGAESGSEQVLKSINKDQDPKLVKKGISHAKGAGLIVQAYFVLGLPGETWETFRQTLRYIQELGLEPGVDKINFFVATPYPGSELYEHPEEFGIKILHENWDLYDCEHVIFETKHLKKEDIEQMIEEAKEFTF